MAREIRQRGTYVIAELEHAGTTEDHDKAMRVRAATGIGTRANLGRQSGLRRLLSLQQAGLPTVADILAAWCQPADLSERIATTLADLETAMVDQSREQIEADVAYDRLDELVETTIETFNRTLMLINTELASAPDELVTSLLSLQGTNSEVFWQPKPEDDEIELDQEPPEDEPEA